MKIIDLLNKIANGEELPSKIKYKNEVLYLDYENTEDNCYNATFNYYDKNGNSELFTGWLPTYINDEIEIIEEDKKIEKWNNFAIEEMLKDNELKNIKEYIKTIMITQNEIIDKLNKE